MLIFLLLFVLSDTVTPETTSTLSVFCVIISSKKEISHDLKAHAFSFYFLCANTSSGVIINVYFLRTFRDWMVLGWNSELICALI